MNSVFSLAGKVAIITGAGRGIGKAIALGFAEAGADVVCAARTVKEIEDTASEIRALGKKSLAIPTDVGNPDQIENLAQKTLAGFGKIDILVNNAVADNPKTRYVGYVLDLSIDAWRLGIEGVLNSVFYCSKIIGEKMVKKRTGNIINISSGMGLGPFPGGACPAAGKAGVINFTKTLALELAPYNIRVNCIAPGFIETPLTAKMWEEQPEGRKSTLKNIPLGYFGKPEEMASVAVFLASKASSY
ncbi:MAG: hypothetical protein A2Z02_05195, partial [Chloroflexi bacterium RBG_16_48_7]